MRESHQTYELGKRKFSDIKPCSHNKKKDNLTDNSKIKLLTDVIKMFKLSIDAIEHYINQQYRIINSDNLKEDTLWNAINYRYSDDVIILLIKKGAKINTQDSIANTLKSADRNNYYSSTLDFIKQQISYEEIFNYAAIISLIQKKHHKTTSEDKDDTKLLINLSMMPKEIICLITSFFGLKGDNLNDYERYKIAEMGFSQRISYNQFIKDEAKENEITTYKFADKINKEKSSETNLLQK